MSDIRYGQDIDYSIDLLQFADRENIKDFKCGKAPLDKYITTDIFSDGVLNCDDGLHYKVIDNSTGKIFGFVSLATSGVFFHEGNYDHVLPAMKIDVFAIDEAYQKMHYDEDSEQSNSHFYLSDSIMANFIRLCLSLNETVARIRYIILYADVDAHRFYIRNGYNDFNPFMLPEHNAEIIENIPMYYDLDSWLFRSLIYFVKEVSYA